MTWEIATAGTLNLDDITTPHGHRCRLLGGSALYFTLSARNYAPVHVHGVVGTDAHDEFVEMLEHHNVTLDGVKTNPRRTRTWKARHDFVRWIAVVADDRGGFESEWDDNWDRRLTPEATRAHTLFVGSMAPAYQLDIIKQSRATLVGSDFMRNFIVHERAAVLDVVSRSDVLFVNHDELSALAEAHPEDWRESARRLINDYQRLRAVVVKAGPLGAALVTKNSITKREPAFVPTVIDPTGAGDSLAGGFLGYCSQLERDDDATFLQALDEGLRCAARAIGSFGTTGLIAAPVA
jgi:sugar/nucleoside kinase (ribokinase family)